MVNGDVVAIMARSGRWIRPQGSRVDAAPPVTAARPPRATVSLPLLGLFAAYLALVAAAGWAVVNLLPDRIAITALGHAVSLGELHRRVLQHGSILVLIVPGVLFAEMVFTGWRGTSLRHLLAVRSPTARSDLAIFALWQTPLMNGLIAVLSLGVTVISGAWLHDRLARLTGVSLSVAALPAAVQVLVFLTVFSFLDYWNHRLDHSRLFWPLHRFHHAAEEFTVLNSVRIHPAAFTSILSATLPAMLFGASPDVIADVNLFVITLRYVIHSRIDSDFGWVGRWIVQSPVHHRLHHVLDMSLPTGHFALMPVWDHLFGTWRPDAGEADQRLVIGVETAYRHGAWVGADIWRDYLDFWKGLRPATRGAAAEQGIV
ncbi:sterol desaturase family protein [Caulobacter sp. KR2-114]|uniref:sterol desaturase family protein n=1 Tax=Caulobacter sp. KR2-114 TaxID=3400912 RepID=UPI003BFB5A31